MTPDVVVIGSGFGGSIAAFRWALAGKSVLVLERGPAVGRDPRNPAERDLPQTQDPRWLVNIFRSYRGVAPPGTESMDVLAGSCVGGGSVVYSGASLRAPGFVFERSESLVPGVSRRLWPSDLSRQTLDPYYDLVSNALPVTKMVWRAEGETDRWMQVARRGAVWARAFLDAGYSKIEPMTQAVTDCLHCGWCNVGCRYDRKNDMLRNYLRAATEKLGVQVQDLSAALTIEPAGDRWRVRYRRLAKPTMSIFDPRGPMDEIEAERVVIAAGTVGTATLLMRSRPFMPKLSPHLGFHLSGNGDLPVAAFLPATAEFPDGPQSYQGVAMDTVATEWLTDAPDEGFVVITQHMLPLSTAVLGKYGNQAGRPPDLWGLDRKHQFHDYGDRFVGLAVVGLDDSEGQIWIDEGQMNDVLLTLGVRFEPTAATKARWNKARAVIKGIVARAGGQFVDLAAELPNKNQTAHPLGTARMAEEGVEQGVVDPSLRVHGYDNLWVVDGSVVPSALAVNPSLTIAAVAERAMLQATGVRVDQALTPAQVLQP